MERFELVDQYVFVLEQDGRLKMASGPCAEIFGFLPDQIVGRPIAHFIADADRILASTSGERVRFANNQGRRFDAMLRGELVETAGRRLRVGLLTDVRAIKDASEHQTFAKAAESAPPQPMSPGPVTAGADFIGGLRLQLAGQQSPHRVLAGRIQVITLEDVQARFGERWGAQAERVRSIASQIIAKRLDRRDVFTVTGETTFVICFASLDDIQAKLKANIIAKEIRERLLGAASLAVETVACVEVIELTKSQLESDDDDLLKSLTAQIDKARAEREGSRRQGVAQLVDRASLAFSPILGARGVPSDLVIARLGGDSVDVLTAVTAADSEQGTLAELDILLMGLVIKYLYTSPAGKPAPRLIVPVGYQTLASRDSLKRFLDVCQRLDSSARARILFEIHGLHPDTPRLRLEELIGRLAPYCSEQLLRLYQLRISHLNLSQPRIRMLSLSGAKTDLSCPKVERNFGRLVEWLRQRKLKLLVRDVRGVEIAHSFIAMGAELVALTRADGAKYQR